MVKAGIKDICQTNYNIDIAVDPNVCVVSVRTLQEDLEFLPGIWCGFIL
jgi:hypothetical protein